MVAPASKQTVSSENYSILIPEELIPAGYTETLAPSGFAPESMEMGLIWTTLRQFVFFVATNLKGNESWSAIFPIEYNKLVASSIGHDSRIRFSLRRFTEQ